MEQPPTHRDAALTAANPTEIEFAPEGARFAAMKMREAAPGSDEEHSAIHEFVDWLMIRHFGRHALACKHTCPSLEETAS